MMVASLAAVSLLASSSAPSVAAAASLTVIPSARRWIFAAGSTRSMVGTPVAASFIVGPSPWRCRGAESADWSLRSSSSSSDAAASSSPSPTPQRRDDSDSVPLYRSEGLLSVHKPLEWTSQDVVAYVRGILSRDARGRGAKVSRIKKRASKREKARMVRVGHGGTLDPLASGVLVLGVGRGTKELQSYLSGTKRYVAGAELGYETTTLDREGNVTRREGWDGVTLDDVEGVLPRFTGKIQQVPPIYSALKRDGKKLYEEARSGATAEELGIEPREVEIYALSLILEKDKDLPYFHLDVECGGGAYIRSLVRDIGRELGTAATMTSLVRTKQGPFDLEDCLHKDDWTADNIYGAIDRNNKMFEKTQVTPPASQYL